MKTSDENIVTCDFKAAWDAIANDLSDSQRSRLATELQRELTALQAMMPIGFMDYLLSDTKRLNPWTPT